VLSRQENRCVLTYLWYMRYSKYLILLVGVFGTGLRKLTAYQMMRLIWGASQVPAKCAEQAFALLNLVAQVTHWTFPAPKIFRLLSILLTPLGRYLRGGGIGSPNYLVKFALSA
jgi:hypothetical protein